MNENKIDLRGISSSVDQAGFFLVMMLILAKNVLLVMFASARQFHKLQIDANFFPCSLNRSRSNGFFSVSFFFLFFLKFTTVALKPRADITGSRRQGYQ